MTSIVSVSSFARDLGVGWEALANRMADLTAAFLTWPHYQDDSHARPDLRSQNKVYFIDPLLARLTSERSSGLIPAPEASQLSEQQLGMALLRSGERAAPGAYSRFDRILLTRTPSRREIDFMAGELPAEPVESKYGNGPWKRDALTLRSVKGHGVIATRNLLDLSESGPDAVWAVPAAMIAALID